MAAFSVELSYGQVAVFDTTLAAPFNDWTDAHILQGFAWRPGSVSFAALETAGALAIKVGLRTLDAATSPAPRIIVVPYTVPEHGRIEVGSIGSSAHVQLAPGEHELTFEHGRSGSGRLWANLYFVRADGPVVPRIVRADGMSPPAALLMVANPA